MTSPGTETGSNLTQDVVELWVVLSEPALASLPREATGQRAVLRERIIRQQDAVMSQLFALGATESGRVQQTSNALAVTLPVAALERVKKIDGVIAVRAVKHRYRINDE
ncbi:MAG TPA: hypothetical protein VIT67_13170 [Povalibacter sp.]